MPYLGILAVLLAWSTTANSAEFETTMEAEWRENPWYSPILVIHKKDPTKNRCILKDLKNNTEKETKLETCTEIIQTTTHWFIKKSKKEQTPICAQFNRKLEILKFLSDSQCNQNSYVVYDSKIKKFIVIKTKQKVNTINNYKYFVNENIRSKFVQTIRADLKSHIIKLKRDITVYFYNSRNKFSLVWKGKSLLPTNGSMPLRNHQTVQFLRNRVQDFWNYQPNESGDLGWGLYAANNNFESRVYGGNSGEIAFVAIDLKEGTTFFDFRNYARKIPLSNQTIDLLSSRCANISTKTESPIDKKLLTKDAFCHAAFTQAVRDLQVAGIIYPWTLTPENKHCGVSNRNRGETGSPAFLLFNTPLNINSTRLFLDDDYHDVANKWEERWYERMSFMQWWYTHKNQYEKSIHPPSRTILWHNNIKFTKEIEMQTHPYYQVRLPKIVSYKDEKELEGWLKSSNFGCDNSD